MNPTIRIMDWLWNKSLNVPLWLAQSLDLKPFENQQGDLKIMVYQHA